VVGVRVGDDEPAHEVEPQVDLVQRALEVRERARAVPARVDEHDPVAGGQGPRVAVRHAGPRQGQAQAPHARQDPLAASDLALAHERGTLPRS
jgi:hypothetical protein